MTGVTTLLTQKLSAIPVVLVGIAARAASLAGMGGYDPDYFTCQFVRQQQCEQSTALLWDDYTESGLLRNIFARTLSFPWRIVLCSRVLQANYL